MADADVQGMLIRIEATTAQLRQEIARGDSAVAQSAGKMDASLGRIDNAFDRTGENASALQRAISTAFTGIGLASAAAVAGLVAITTKTTNYAQEVKNLSSLSNSSVTDFQRLAAGAKTVGVEQDKLGDILKDTTDRVGEFIQRGGGEMADFFKEIAPKVGVTAQMFANLSGPDALQLYYNSLEKAGLNQAQMTTYMESTADEATALIPLLKNNGEGFKTFGDRAEKAGQILSALEIDRLVEVNQSIKALEGSFEGASRQLVLGMLPGIQSVTEQLTGMANNGALETLGAGVSFLAEHLNILAAVMGAKVTASFVGYVQSLGASALASNQARAANVAQAASAVEAATANQIAAQSAVVRAEREAIAARGTAVQTQMSIQLAEARMAERTATAQLAAAQTALKGTSGGLLGILGGPAGIAALAIGAGIAFLTMRDNTSLLEKKLGDLADPLDKLTDRFTKLNRATQAVTLRELQASIADTQTKLGQMSGAMADKFENDLRNMGAAGADGLMAGLVSLPKDAQAALDLVRKTSKDQASGMVVDWKAVADQLRQVPGVTEEMAQALESGQAPVTDLSVVLQKQQQTLAALTAETDKNTVSQNQNSAAKDVASAAGKTYIDTLTKALHTAQDKTAVEAANRFISENTDLTKEQIAEILKLATAKDAQKKADDAATKATQDSGSAAKKTASEEAARAKALADLKAQIDIAVASATGLSAAYLDGTDKSREFSLQQKIEEALLKTGAAARAEVIAKLTAERDAQDKLNISKSVYDLQKETADQVALATAILKGADALAAYNTQKAMTVALAGKNIEVGSKEYEQLLAATKAQQDAVKVAQQATNAGGIMDRLYPEAKLLKDYTADQQALNAAMVLYPQNAANYQAALVKLSNEYEVNRSKATLWGQMTEGAIDRIDEAFANAWGNIGSGAENLWDNLKQGFKQTLGEIAHMLTTKPLLASISNWLTGTDNGQGLSSVWGKLFGGAGGSSSGSGGGMFSNLAGIGKNLYSAWSAITGVGSSVASGYASGGISGALSGGVGYYSNMLSSLTSTLSSGFSGLSSAIFGSSASQIAANAATTAALQGAIGEGAASVGTSIGVGGLAAEGAGAAATAAAAGAGSGFYASLAAMASNPVGWVIAAVTSAYQSGKLYDKGIRPDAGEMWDSGGGTVLGKSTMLPAAATAKYFEVADKLLGKVVGGKMAAMLTGSTLFQAVWSKVGSKLFGSGYQTKDAGVQLSVSGGMLEAYQYQDQKKKGGLISGSSKKRTLLSPLDAERQQTVQSAFDERLDQVFSLFDTLNVEVPEAALDGLNMAAWKISLKDLTTEQVNQLFSDFFEVLGNEAVGAISKSMGLGLDSYNVDQLTEFASNLFTINDVFKLLNVNALPVSVWGGKLAEQYVAMAGGMEAFSTVTQGYYNSPFFTEAERNANTLEAVKKQFADLNIAFPASREGFRALVEGIDSTTDAGRQMFITLMGLSNNASTGYDILQQQADAAAAAVQALSDKLLGVVSTANSALQRAISAQQKATTEAYNKQIGSLNDMVTTITDNVSGLTAIGNDLGAALKALRGDSDDAVKMLRAQAQATLQNALATARSGGSLSGFAGLEDALDVVSSNNTDLYGSLEDYAREQGRTANVVAELNGINGQHLSTAEKALEGLKKQIKVAEDGYKLQMAQYDAQLAFAQAQMDALNGVDNSVMAVTAAINAMNAAVVAALAGMGGKGAGNSAATNGTFIDSIYKDVLGRDADAAGKNYWLGELANGHLTLDQLAQAIANAAKEKGQAVKAGYATGGFISGPGTGTSDSILARLSNGEYVLQAAAVRRFGTGLLDQMNAGQLPVFALGGGVGELGPQLDVTGPSQIAEASHASSLRGAGSFEALLDELRKTREENKEQRFQMAKASKQVAALMQKWDAEGAPKERDYAL